MHHSDRMRGEGAHKALRHRDICVRAPAWHCVLALRCPHDAQGSPLRGVRGLGTEAASPRIQLTSGHGCAEARHGGRPRSTRLNPRRTVSDGFPFRWVVESGTPHTHATVLR